MHAQAAASVAQLVTTPDAFDAHFQTYSYGVIARCFFGLRIESPDDRFIRENEAFLNRTMEGFDPTVYPINVFPWLKYAPKWLVPSLRKMEKLRALSDDRIQNLSRDVEKERTHYNASTDLPGIFNEFLANRKDYDISDIEANNAFYALIGGGTRSTHNALLTFIYLMMAYPEWQTKLQRHVDEVVGPGRLPNWDDIPNLPMVRAVVKEGIRYRSMVAELGIPHRLEEDDVYDGYFFAKGTVFHANYGCVLIC